MNIEIEQLISLVHERPLLWDKTLEEHKYKNLTLKAWEEVCAILIDNFENLDEHTKRTYGNMVIKKWKNIKDCWLKFTKKVESERKSGMGVTRSKKYVYDDQLQFLRKIAPIEYTTTSLATCTATLETEDGSQDHQANDSASARHPPSASAFNISTSSACKRQKKDDVPRSAEKTRMQLLPKREDRHLSFFRGILPSLRNFDERKIRKFQMAVLQVIDNLDNNLPPFPSYPYQLYQTDPPNYFHAYPVSHRSNSENNVQSPQSDTNLSDDALFQ